MNYKEKINKYGMYLSLTLIVFVLAFFGWAIFVQGLDFWLLMSNLARVESMANVVFGLLIAMIGGAGFKIVIDLVHGPKKAKPVEKADEPVEEEAEETEEE